jgi:uncharacterized membrane protein YebE (DUF533 family)
MGLVSTLAKVALGVAIAKGASHVSRNGMPKLGNGGLSGGLGGMLEKLGANSTANHDARPPHASGFGGLLAKAGPALGGLLGSQTPPPAPTTAPTAASAPAGLGPIFNQAIVGTETPEPTRDQELAAALMLRAMVQAVMADGKLDDAESAKLMQHLDSATDAERAYVKQLLDQPVDVDGLAFDVPDGMEEQVYLISLMAIDLDSRAEAQYLHDLASALALDQSMVNAIHQDAGLPALYA